MDILKKFSLKKLTPEKKNKILGPALRKIKEIEASEKTIVDKIWSSYKFWSIAASIIFTICLANYFIFSWEHKVIIQKKSYTYYKEIKSNNSYIQYYKKFFLNENIF